MVAAAVAAVLVLLEVAAAVSWVRALRQQLLPLHVRGVLTFLLLMAFKVLALIIVEMRAIMLPLFMGVAVALQMLLPQTLLGLHLFGVAAAAAAIALALREHHPLAGTGVPPGQQVRRARSPEVVVALAQQHPALAALAV